MKNHNPYTAGIPDCWYSGRQGDLWIEYKWLAKPPVTARVQPQNLLSALQRTWLNNRQKEGRRVCVIIGCDEGGVLLQDGEWDRSLSAETFKRTLLPIATLAQWISEQVQGESHENQLNQVE